VWFREWDGQVRRVVDCRWLKQCHWLLVSANRIYVKCSWLKLGQVNSSFRFYNYLAMSSILKWIIWKFNCL
jgi:hypothetical protein